MASSKTVAVQSPPHFTQILSSSRLVVTDFWAAWCGPCKAVAPIYEQLSAQLSRPGQITFTTVDVDQQKEIAQSYNISAMPTFLIFKAGREIKRVRGADPKALDAAVRQLAQEAASAGDEGSSGGGAGAAAAGSASGNWTAMAPPRGYSDITDQVDALGLDFLNLDGQRGEKRILFSGDKPSALSGLEGGKKDWIESDTDEQLMLFIPFQSALKLHTLHITSLPPQDDDDVTRPKTLHFYTNRSTVLGFDEADDTPATQSIELKESDWDGKTGTAKVELRFVKFQNISSVVVFVQSGEDADAEKTRIDRLRLCGESGEKRAIGKLEKIGDAQGE